MFKRKPDVIIGELDNLYLLRWWLIPRNKYFNIYLHKFMASDDYRALHDHPWLFNCSILLRGKYKEYTCKYHGHPDAPFKIRRAWINGFKFRWGKHPHRIELFEEPLIDDQNRCYGCKRFYVWTLFITGPVIREWGFYCQQGWRHWKEYTEGTGAGNRIGRGCD